MKRPTVASLKKVTVANLSALGADRLAEILFAVADGRPDLKRRLRMELAAEQGAEHLSVEIDKRLDTLRASRSKVSWRQRSAFLRDLDALGRLIVDRLAPLDGPGATARLWSFLDLAGPINARVRDKEGVLDGLFLRAAGDLGRLIQDGDVPSQAAQLAEAMGKAPGRWTAWLPELLASPSVDLASATLHLICERPGPASAWAPLVRLLADAAGNPDAFQATFTPAALKTSSVAADVGRRLLDAGRTAEAGAALSAAKPGFSTARAQWEQAADYAWETVWIDYLDAAGRGDDAQQARWASFERTLSAERAKAYTRRLPDFDDVEAEGRAFEHAARHPKFARALRFLMEWPALAEAGRLIVARRDEAVVDPGEAESWGARLRDRQPAAAGILLRKAAAEAFRRRDFATCDRLTQEADSIGERA